jgi:putative ABC transport system permease protein
MPASRALDRRVHGIRECPEIAWRRVRHPRGIQRTAEHVPGTGRRERPSRERADNTALSTPATAWNAPPPRLDGQAGGRVTGARAADLSQSPNNGCHSARVGMPADRSRPRRGTVSRVLRRYPDANHIRERRPDGANEGRGLLFAVHRARETQWESHRHPPGWWWHDCKTGASVVDGNPVAWSNGVVRAIAMRIGASLRQGWKASLLVMVLVAGVGGAVLTLVAGARRTATAPDRYTSAVGGDFDGLVTQPLGPARLAEIDALPAVAEVRSLTFVIATVGGREPVGEGGGLGGGVNPFAGTGALPGARLVMGRFAEPTRPHEFVANVAFAETFSAEVGDRFPVATWTQAQVDANAFDDLPSGPSFDGVLVGVVDSPDDFDDPTPSVVFPEVLLDEDVGVVSTLFAVRLVPGVSGDDLRAQLDALPHGNDLALDEDVGVVSPTVRNAVSALAAGLWVIALVAAVAGIATLGQILSRHARVPEGERLCLVALGASRVHILGEAVGRAAVPATLGLAVGMVGAAFASQLFPVGFVRRLEPATGVRVDAYLLLPVVGTMLVCLLAWVLAGAWLGQRSRRTEQGSPLVELVATRAGTAAAAGMRFAFVRNPRETGSVAGTLAGLTVAIVGLVGSAAFAISVDRLVTDSGRSGTNFDLLLGNGWLPAGSDLRVALDGDDDVESLMLLGAGAARAGDTTVELVAFDAVRGGLTPRLIDGRLPAGADELALGRLTADQLDVGVGDELTLQGADAPATFRVVGAAVLPTLGSNNGVGVGALLTFDGMQQVAPEVTRSAAAIVVRPEAPPDVGRRLGELTSTPQGDLVVPAPIRNVARVDLVPVLLAAFLTVLAAALLAHALVQSVRARRGDHAILRALGADRRCISQAVHFQATALIAVPLLIGIPLGLVVGRLVYAAFVNRTGAIPDPTTPALLAIGVAGGVLLLANVVAAQPARWARKAAPAALLRAE